MDDREPASPRTCPWCSAANAVDAASCAACGAALAQRESLGDVAIPGVTAVDPGLAAYAARPMHLKGPSPSQGLAGGAVAAAAMGGPAGLAALGGLGLVAAAEYLGASGGDRATVDPSKVGELTELQRLALEKERTGMLGAMTEAATPPILVLGRDTCEDTIRSRRLLIHRHVPFTYRRVDQDPEADAWIRRLNDGEWRTPTILVGPDPEHPDAILREPSDEELLAAIGLG